MENQEITYFQKKYGKGWLQKYNSYKNNSKYTSYGVKRRAHWNDFDYYKQTVQELTNNNILHIPNSYKRGFNQYHVDHKISIKFGFENGILEEQIAHPSNLEMLWWKDNVRKSVQCKIDEDNKWILLENEITYS
jgi:hypothetical protein